MRVLNPTTEDPSFSTVADDGQVWVRNRPVLEEVFVSEMLTRVWGAILAAADSRRRICHAEPIARNTLIGHLEARHLALRQMVNGSDMPLNELAEIDRLRRRTERWTDLLLGHLVKQYDVADFAFEPRRALDFGSEQLSASPTTSPCVVWDFLLASLRLSFPKKPCRSPVSMQIHRGITGSVMACFPPDAFQGDGPLKSVSVLRIGRSGLHPEGPPDQGLARQDEQNATLAAQKGQASKATWARTSRISFSQFRRRSRPYD